MVLMVRAPAWDLERRAVWARSRVRIAPSDLPDWTLVDVGSDDQAGLERVAQEVTAAGPGVLLVVGEWRSALSLWAQGRRRASVAWTSGEVNGLDEHEAMLVAAELGHWLRVDSRSLVSTLRSPATADQGWRDLTTALGVPVPAGFPPRGSGALDSARARVLERRTLLDAAAEVKGDKPLPLTPNRAPEPAWRLAARILLLAGFLAGLAWAAAQDPPRVVVCIALALGAIALSAEVVRQAGLRATRRGRR